MICNLHQSNLNYVSIGFDCTLELLIMAFVIISYPFIFNRIVSYPIIILKHQTTLHSYITLSQMKSLTKTLKGFKLQKNILLPDVKIQQQINDTPRKVTEYHYCKSRPKQRAKVHLAGLSKSILKELDLDYQSLLKDQNTAQYLSGNKLLQNSEPICNNYCGHQFGNWAQQLGDGRAHTLGFYKNSANKLYQLQLKGSGKTPFSRFADGNSVTSSALREFLASEAMFYLGIPTTRAASLVIAEEMVKRDPFYDGNIKYQKATIVLRVSPSFLRFGSFQICLPKAQCYSKQPLKNRQFLLPLADFLLKNHFQHIISQESDPYEQMFIEIVRRSARLVAKWMSVGFVQGVLNTDNMSMLGVTIDYGPFAFIDYFSRDYVSNMTDQEERYSYRRQPAIIRWNLNRLAEAMDPIVPVEILKKHINEIYQKQYKEEYNRLFHNKLGIKQNQQSEALIEDLLDIMDKYNSNYTNVWRILSEDEKDINKIAGKLTKQGPSQQLILRYLKIYPQLIAVNAESILKQDEGYNIFFIKEQSKRLQKYKMLKSQEQQDYLEEQQKDWREWLERYHKHQINREVQSKTNPKYVLRNDVASNILKELNGLADEKQPEFLERVLKVFEEPYVVNEWFEEKFWNKKCDPVKLTCSS